MGPNELAFFIGQFSAQRLAFEMLIRVFHAQGVLNASHFIETLKATYNQPNAYPERADYEYFRKLAVDLESWVADQPPFSYRQAGRPEDR